MERSKPCRVLVWAHDPGVESRILASLQRSPWLACGVECLECAGDPAGSLSEGRADVVLLALGPDEGLQRLRAARETAPGIPVVVLLPPGRERLGLEALEAGAGGVLRQSRADTSGLVLSIGAALRAGDRERELRSARDEAEQAARAKSEFLASVSHELRTPIHAIIASTELLQETKLDDEQREYAGTVRSSAAILLGLVNDVLDISRVEAGRLALEAIDFDLCTVVEEAVGLSALEAQRKGLELAARLPVYLPETLRGDPARLRQVLVNLVNNAVKFTHEGEVVVSVERRQGDRAGELEFSVRDTGIGIPEDRRSQLFQSFSQLDTATNRKYGGTGLGLAISRRLVEMMGGRIGVEASPGRGSRFWFTLPAPPPSPGESASLVPPDFFSGLRVLIVDDNGSVRAILREHLASWGCAVGEAGGAAEALDLLRAAAGGPGPWQLALVDLRMPGQDGWQLASAVRGDPAISSTRLILLSTTGLAAEEAKLKLLRWFNGYVTKPVRRQRLVEAVFTATSADLGLASLPSWGPQEEPLPAGDWHVLVVDDAEVSRELFRTVLEKAGYRVDTASDGPEAIGKVSASAYDLVFMDVNMPGESGLQVVRRMRERGIATTVVAVTASAQPDEQARCLASGMNDFLAKPFYLDDLARLLARWLPGAPSAAPGQGIPRERQAAAPAADGKEAAAAPGPGSRDVLDMPAAVATFLGRADLVHQLLGGLIQRAEDGLATLRGAAARGDMEAVRLEAHAIKGAALNLSAHRLAGSCRLLELCAADGKVHEIPDRVESVRRAVAELKAAAAEIPPAGPP